MSPEERSEMIARRDKEAVRASDRARYERHREDRLAASREYRGTPEGREAVSRAQAAHKERHPSHVAARLAVSNAIRDGRLKREPCAICESGADVEAHHEDYSRPLEVVWLCGDHHRQVHGKRPAVPTDHQGGDATSSMAA